MKQSTSQLIDDTIAAWDLYCLGEFQTIEQRFSESPNEEIQDIVLLSRLENRKNSDPVLLMDRSLFSPLVSAMTAHSKNDHHTAAGIMGEWLSEKNFFSARLLNRFVESATRSERFELIHQVAGKFLSNKKHAKHVIRPYFHSTFHLGKHNEVLQLYRDHGPYLQDLSDLQRLAFSMMQLGLYAEAEKLLLKVYEREHGKPYSIAYEDARKKHSMNETIMKKLESVPHRTFDESWELGMAYLFREDFDRALQVFQNLLPDDSKSGSRPG